MSQTPNAAFKEYGYKATYPSMALATWEKGLEKSPLFSIVAGELASDSLIVTSVIRNQKARKS